MCPAGNSGYFFDDLQGWGACDEVHAVPVDDRVYRLG
jgi:hypothetical protein